MIQLIKHKDIDKQKWDDCIDKSTNALPYAYSWYLDVVTNNFWDAFVLDDYSAVFPVPYNRKRIIKSCYQPFFTQQLGVFSPDIAVVQNAKPFIELLFQHYFKVYLHLNAMSKIETDISNEYRITHQMSLSKKYEAVYNAYSSVVKNNLQRLGKGVYEIIYSNSMDDIIDFTWTNIGDKVSELKPKDYENLQRLLNTLIEQNKGFIITVSDAKKNILAKAFIIKSNRMLIYLMAASTKQGRKVNAMTALIDDLFKKYIESDFIFDFEGSMIPGIANFYRNFGAEEIRFPVINK